MIGLVEAIQAVIVLIRLLDDVLDALARKHPESGELRVLIAESRIARTKEERRKANENINAHFRNRS